MHDATETHTFSTTSDEDDFHESIEQENGALLAHVTQRNLLPPGHLHRLLSDNDTPSTATPPIENNIPSLVNNTSTKYITLDGIKYRPISNLNVVYYYSYALKKGSLVDRSVNGILCGTDVRLIEKTRRSVNIQGIGNHQITDVPIITAGAISQTQRVPVIIIIHQYTYIGHGKIIYSSG